MGHTMPTDLKDYPERHAEARRAVERAERLKYGAYIFLALLAVLAAYALADRIDGMTHDRVSTRLMCPQAAPQSITTFAIVITEGTDGAIRELRCAVVQTTGAI